MFARLVCDRESEVRTVASQRLLDVATICKSCQSAIIEHLVPTFDALAADASAPVRTSFAGTLVALCAIIGKVTRTHRF